jgi:hypothetical protein
MRKDGVLSGCAGFGQQAVKPPELAVNLSKGVSPSVPHIFSWERDLYKFSKRFIIDISFFSTVFYF